MAVKKTTSGGGTKKPTTRKTTVKKSTGTSTKKAPRTSSKKTVKKAVRKQTVAEKKLVKELTELLPQLDGEGLTFLIEQANVHLYNMSIVELEEERQRLIEEQGNIVTTQPTKPEKKSLTITRNQDGSVYHIIYDGKYSMLNDDEMLAIIKIAQAPHKVDEAKNSLYHWFFRERRDFINANGLGDINDEVWLELVELIRTTFKVRERKNKK